jgi:hypothetical protein
MVMRNAANNTHFGQQPRFFDSELILLPLSHFFLKTLILNQFEVNEMCLVDIFDEAPKLRKKSIQTAVVSLAHIEFYLSLKNL